MQVFVYYNLHKHCLSVRAMQGPERGRVVAHCSQVLLKDIVFKVSEAGRQRVLATRTKNVHAGVTGTWLNRDANFEVAEDVLAARSSGTAVTYDPYKWNSFVERYTEEPVFSAERALIVDKWVTAWNVGAAPPPAKPAKSHGAVVA